jgi:hypothetical protein
MNPNPIPPLPLPITTPRILSLVPPAIEIFRQWCNNNNNSTTETDINTIFEQCVHELELACKEFLEQDLLKLLGNNNNILQQVVSSLPQLDGVFFEPREGGQQQQQSFMVLGIVWKSISKIITSIQTYNNNNNDNKIFISGKDIVEICINRLDGSCNVKLNIEVGKKMRSFFVTRLIGLLSSSCLIDVNITPQLLETTHKLEILSRDQDWKNLILNGICIRLDLNTSIKNYPLSMVSYLATSLLSIVGSMNDNMERNETIQIILNKTHPVVIVPELCSTYLQKSHGMGKDDVIWKNKIRPILVENLMNNTELSMEILLFEWTRNSLPLVDLLWDLSMELLMLRHNQHHQLVHLIAIESLVVYYGQLWMSSSKPSNNNNSNSNETLLLLNECERLLSIAWCIDPYGMMNLCLNSIPWMSSSSLNVHWNLYSCAAAKALQYVPDIFLTTKKNIIHPTLLQECGQRLSELLNQQQLNSNRSTQSLDIEIDALLCFLDFGIRCCTIQQQAECTTITPTMANYYIKLALAALKQIEFESRSSAITLLGSCTKLFTTMETIPLLLDVLTNIIQKHQNISSIFMIIRFFKLLGLNAIILRGPPQQQQQQQQTSNHSNSSSNINMNIFHELNTCIISFSCWLVKWVEQLLQQQQQQQVNNNNRPQLLLASVFESIRAIASNTCMQNVTQLVPPTHKSAFYAFLQEKTTNKNGSCNINNNVYVMSSSSSSNPGPALIILPKLQLSIKQQNNQNYNGNISKHPHQMTKKKRIFDHIFENEHIQPQIEQALKAVRLVLASFPQSQAAGSNDNHNDKNYFQQLIMKEFDGGTM